MTLEVLWIDLYLTASEWAYPVLFQFVTFLVLDKFLHFVRLVFVQALNMDAGKLQEVQHLEASLLNDRCLWDLLVAFQALLLKLIVKALCAASKVTAFQALVP